MERDVDGVERELVGEMTYDDARESVESRDCVGVSPPPPPLRMPSDDDVEDDNNRGSVYPGCSTPMIHIGSVHLSGWATSESKTQRTARSRFALPGMWDMIDAALLEPLRDFCALGLAVVAWLVVEDEAEAEAGRDRPSA